MKSRWKMVGCSYFAVSFLEFCYGNNKQLFYVGSSRAKLNLEMITTMNEKECFTALINLNYQKIRQNKLKV